jgi:hypothetical protein
LSTRRRIETRKISIDCKTSSHRVSRCLLLFCFMFILVSRHFVFPFSDPLFWLLLVHISSISCVPPCFSIHLFVSFETALIPASASFPSPILRPGLSKLLTIHSTSIENLLASSPVFRHSQQHRCQRYRKRRRHRGA